MSKGDRIRRARERVGISQRELARRLGLSHGVVSHWERGDRGIQIENLIAIASKLNINIAFLLQDDEPGQPIIVSDPTEKTVVELLRQLPPSLRSRYVSLLAEQIALIEEVRGGEKDGEPP